MKKNYRKPIMKLHDVKVRTAMFEGSLDVDNTPEEGFGNAKERNAGDWEEF